jgi:hypothetical protein
MDAKRGLAGSIWHGVCATIVAGAGNGNCTGFTDGVGLACAIEASYNYDIT